MIQSNPLSELSGTEVYEIFLLRQQVFMIEQNCLYQDIDPKDANALHLRYLDDANHLQGYLRIISATDDSGPSIGRVAVRRKARSQGIARQIMEQAIELCQQQSPGQKIRIAAQTYLIDFYSSLGFVSIGPEYLEDDIPHQDMVF